ncbi:hypothetical protein DWB85_06495 [Seongchinamella sediminis]|uniref:Uncharacterized protein n=1 Tax=Seongchinamella sediminis TaxID=2283635 RepID=A0A3L7DZG9_9GAMM|nr:SMP-30/gluconolactonase/LRE family protein [Seongchinamella sediminis]RLQ22626.1 hypothetical protein DWB85_06495 [Seongchinamella sediminis]
MLKAIFPLALLALLSACVDDAMHITGCAPLGDIVPVCGMQTPEDIAALPDGRHLLLANFGGMHDGTGSLSLFDTESQGLTPLFPPADGRIDSGDPLWGEAGCEPPPLAEFSPHGTHLHQLADGRWRYLVVNHGGREAIEMFELLGRGEQSRLAWRGCVPAGPDTFMNDVVGLASGELVFTRMYHHGGGRLELLLSLLGRNTGDLWRWSRERGLRVIPGTEANQPNGIEISADEQYVFANMYMTGEVWKVDIDTAEVVATAPVASGDNSAWGSDGRLWVVTHTDSLPNLLSCFDHQAQPCGAGFAVVALDPDTMAWETVFEHRGAPMGAATVAVPQNGRVYMGSFVGDRLISVADFGAPG